MLANSEEHGALFPETPVTAFRRCKNLRDMLLRARLTNNNNDRRGCSRCNKSSCQVYKSMTDNDSFHSFNVVYLYYCVVCGIQYVGALARLLR